MRSFDLPDRQNDLLCALHATEDSRQRSIQISFARAC